MVEEYKQPVLEADDKRKKIENYFSGQKRQKLKMEKIQKPEAVSEDGDIFRLKKELDLAREQYISANFETDSALVKIKKFLHVKEDLSDKEALDLKYSRYKSKLNELLSLEIDELKRQNPEGVKIGEKINSLKKNFELNEDANLQRIRVEFESRQEEASGGGKRSISEKTEKAAENLSYNSGESDLEKEITIVLKDLKQCIDENAAIFGKKWEGIKDVNVYRIIKDMNWRKNNELDSILRKLQKTLGTEVRPGGPETLEKWLERLSRLATEKGK